MLPKRDSQKRPLPLWDEFVFYGSMVWIGVFRCHHTHALFGGEHCFIGHHMIVFPRTVVQLAMNGGDPLIGSPNTAVFYNHQTVYKRTRLVDDRDRCDYFQFDPHLVLDVLDHLAPDAQRDPYTPFQFNQAFISRHIFLLQRQLMQVILHTAQPDVLKVDETAVYLLETLIADSLRQFGIHPHTKLATTQRIHRQLAHAAQMLLATRFSEQWTLQKVADALYVSPYHLSRVFRQQTGCTLHHFLEQLRLRTAYERLGDYANNLSQLALDVGYATHSHFTEAFHRNFGNPPSSI